MILREQVNGIDTFRLPKSIYKSGALKTLSGDAIALFLVISYKCFRARLPRYDFSFRELYRELELGAQDICRAAKELHTACITQDRYKTIVNRFLKLRSYGRGEQS